MLKGLDVHQVRDAPLLGEGLGAVRVALAHQVVDEEAVEASPAPLLILDVLEGMHAAQLAEVLGARADLPVQACLLAGAGGELALDAANARDDAVEAAEDVIRGGAALEGGVGRVLEGLLDVGALLLDGEVGGAEVLVEELVGEPDEGLVLCGLGGGGDVSL